MTRRYLILCGIVTPIVASADGFDQIEKQRAALQKIMRLAEKVAGIHGSFDRKPMLPRPGSIWHEFWRIAADGLS